MKVLSADFSKTNKGYNVAMCMFTGECENKIKYMEVFNKDCKLEDIAELIINKFELLNCDYVITDGFGLGVVINSILKDKLGYKVRTHNPYALENNKMIEMLYKDKILEELGLELKCCTSSDYKLTFNRKEYTNFEYLMVKSIGMANKLLNEIKEELINNKVPLGDINITVKCNTDISIEELSKEVEKMVSNAYKDMANNWSKEFKYEINEMPF